ncbi:MAG: phycobilisome linker polypeptide [Cyanobacteriota bacterium]|jgi:phycocyanin-associated rod protein
MKVSAGSRGTSSDSSRQVSITVTGLANNDFVRSADCVMRVPYTRMNETMRMVQRMGGRITDVSVSGSSID